MVRIIEEYRQPALVLLVVYVGTIFGGGYLVRSVTNRCATTLPQAPRAAADLRC